MSAVRTHSSRAESRKKASPYYRVVNRVLGYFGYAIAPMEGQQASGDAGSRKAVDVPPTQKQQARRDDLAKPQLASGKSSNHMVPDASQVASFFSERSGQNITTNAVEHMVEDLQTTPEHQRFRFTFTSPARDTSPSSSNNATTPTTVPRKTLTRNPNGKYRWDGAGSAKQSRSRNRYAAPAFGASPNKSDRPTTNESPAQDTKRRRVGEDQNSSAQPSGSIPFPIVATPPRANGTAQQKPPQAPPTPSSQSRLRTPAKSSAAPVNPSPLRQAWSDASSSSSKDGDRQSPSQPARQSKSAVFMAGLIEKSAPPKKPDLSNPYQTASPVNKVGGQRRSKRVRSDGRASAARAEAERKKALEEKKKKDEEQKMKEVTPQAIIEATLPKGSQRSRPPSQLAKSSTAAEELARPPSPPKRKYPSPSIEEVEDDDVIQSPKKSKASAMSLGNGRPSSLARAPPLSDDVEVEEVQDEDMEKDKKEPAAPATNGFLGAQSTSAPNLGARSSALKSAPSRPSKLRFSTVAEIPSPPPGSTGLPTATSAPSVLATAVTPAPPPIASLSNGFNFEFKPTNTNGIKPVETPAPVAPKPAPVSFTPGPPLIPPPAKDDPASIKARVQGLPTSSLPEFVFTFGQQLANSAPDHAAARTAALGVAMTSLPTFDLTKKVVPSTFDPPKASSSGSKTTSVFGSSFGGSSSSATPAPPPKPAVQGFNFAAAGMQAPVANKKEWTCGICMLSNAVEKAKCVACDGDRPASAAPSTAASTTAPSSSAAPPAAGFNWAAAGMKAPTADKAQWVCGTCMLKNAPDLKKCSICDTDKPAS